MSPESPNEFKDRMFRAIATQPGIRNGHVLIRLCDIKS
jgi:hypothetical protein